MAHKQSGQAVQSETEENLSILESKRNAAEIAISEAGAVRKRVLADIDLKKKELDDCTNRKNILDVEIVHAKETLKGYGEDVVKAKEQLSDFEDKSEASIKEIKASLGKLISERTDLGNEILKLKQSIVELEGAETKAKLALDQTKKDLLNVEDKISESNKLLETIKKNILEQESILNDKLLLIKEADKKLEDIDLEISKQKKELSKQKESLAIVELSVKTAQTELKNTQDQFAKETAVMDASKEELASKAKIAAAAETRVQEKTEFLQRVIEKAKVDKLIGDFKI